MLWLQYYQDLLSLSDNLVIEYKVNCNYGSIYLSHKYKTICIGL